MSNIPQGTKFHGVDPSVETVNKGSATANALRDAYTIDDMVNYFGVKGLFTQIEHGPVVENTTDELTVIGNGLGSLSIPANGFVRGNTFKCYLEGSLSSLNNANLTINIRDNGNILATTGAMSLVSTSGNFYQMEITFVIRQIGAAGTAEIMTSGAFNYTKTANNSPEVIGFEQDNATTFDTTTDSTLDITAQWGAADPANSIDTHVLTLQRIF
jgi:hypothetical protein